MYNGMVDEMNQMKLDLINCKPR